MFFLFTPTHAAGRTGPRAGFLSNLESLVAAWAANGANPPDPQWRSVGQACPQPYRHWHLYFNVKKILKKMPMGRNIVYI